jgi:catechol 2,3-dioxygenase-like lactoylglutathione lyase family enzyme
MLHHVTREIPRPRLELCLQFYSLLGFDEVPTPDSIGDRARWLEASGTQIHLMPADDPRPPDGGHLAVVAADYEAVVTRLREAGHEVSVRAEHWGAPRCMTRDPAGHGVEVMAWPPGPWGAEV